MGSKVVTIYALDPTNERVNWTETLSFPIGSASVAPHVQDRSLTTATLGERRHQLWLDAGTWEAYLAYERIATLGGTCEILIDGVSVGTIDTTGTSNTLVAKVGTTFAVAQPGLHWVTIRKTAATAAGVRFIRLDLRRIS